MAGSDANRTRKLRIIAQDPQGNSYTGAHPLGSILPVRYAGCAYLEIQDLGPSEVLILTNRP